MPLNNSYGGFKGSCAGGEVVTPACVCVCVSGSGGGNQPL